MLPYLLYPLLAVTLLFVGALIFYVYAKQKGIVQRPAKIVFLVAMLLFVVTIIVCVALQLRYRLSLDPNADDVFFIHSLYFYPLVASVALIAVTVIAYFFAKANDRFLKQAKWAIGGAVLSSLIVLVVCVLVYFKREIATDESFVALNSALLYVGAVGVVIVLCVLSAFFGEKSKGALDSRSVSYGAVCLAMSFALSYIALWKMPQGGSVTLVSLLPIMFYSQMFGVRKGVFVGLIYGLLQAIQDPWILHPAQFLLDYPIAFACIGLTSIFTQNGIKEKRGIAFFSCGAVLAVLLRYFSHVISGIFAFSMWAREGYSAVAWGFLYNTFCLVDMAIALTVGVIMLFNSSFRKMIDRVTATSFLPKITGAAPTAESTDSGEGK